MNADSSIPEYVTAAIDHGNQLIAAWERVAIDNTARNQAEERAEIFAAWQPVLATIQQATPSWVHEHIVIPIGSRPSFMDIDYDTYLLPAVIDLSTLLADVPTIRVWAKPHNRNPMILFEAGRHSLVRDDEAGIWCVFTRFDNYKVTTNNLCYFQPGNEAATDNFEAATDNFHVALAQAVADRTDLAELQAEADRLNAIPVTEPVEASVPPAPIDPLERIATSLERIARSSEVAHPF